MTAMAIFVPPPKSTRGLGIGLLKPVIPAPPSAELTWHALVVGVDSYSPSIRQLNGSVNDALSIRTLLTERVGVKADSIRFLLAPRGPLPPDATLATSKNVREALANLTESAKRGDHVFIYYAGHGVRIERATGPQIRVYGFAPTDIELGDGTVTNLILGNEINGALRKLTDNGAVVTVVADTCHAGSSTRGLELGARGIEVKALSDAAWSALVKNDPPPETVTAGASRGIIDAKGWIGRPTNKGDDWVFLSACCDTESAKEDRFDNLPHGLFTAALLEALKAVTGDEVASLRWMDLYPKVRDGALLRIRNARRTSQTPTLEGRLERTVFGGPWSPFDPGFTAVQRGTTEIVELDGGLLHGLDVGAEIAIYPPGTASFAVADGKGVVMERATIDYVAPATSTARLVTAGAQVAKDSRARLVRPGPATARVGVLLTDVPAEIVAVVARTPGVADFLALNPDSDPIEVEVLPWAGKAPLWYKLDPNAPSWIDKSDGWVLVPYVPPVPPAPKLAADGVGVSAAPVARELSTDEVIAFLPRLATTEDSERATALGEALGRGLVHWARYLRVRGRQNTDSALMRIIDVVVHVAPEGSPVDPAEKCKILEPDAAGFHDIQDGDAVWIELRIKQAPKQRLYTGILVCSDDGNILLTWPPNGSSPAMGAIGEEEQSFLTTSSETVFVGLDRFNPAYPQRRPDQSSSKYTFKIVAYTAPDGQPPRLASLAQDDTVQDVIDRALTPATRGNLGTRGGIDGRSVAPPPQTPLWCTWDLVIRVNRR
jgi:hypothetical protein